MVGCLLNEFGDRWITFFNLSFGYNLIENLVMKQ
jgi:hypothetical protein